MSSLPSCRYHPDVHDGVRHCARCGLTYCSNCLVDINGLPHCSVCKSEQLMDLRSGVDRTTLPLASLGKRSLGWLVDYVLQVVVNWMIMIPWMWAFGMWMNPNPTIRPAFFLIYIPTLAIPIVYEGLMLSYRNGQTLGKIAARTRVVRPDGSPISKGQAWGRAVLRTLFYCLIIFDYVPAFFTKERTTLHDMAVGTRVVDAE